MGVRASEVKQPREIIRKGIDFTGSKKMIAGDTLKLSESTVFITDEDGEDVTGEMLVANTLTVSIMTNEIWAMIKGGTAGKEYKISFLAGTEAGELLEEDIILPVEDL
jgi:hypothetical protein